VAAAVAGGGNLAQPKVDRKLSGLQTSNTLRKRLKPSNRQSTGLKGIGFGRGGIAEENGDDVTATLQIALPNVDSVSSSSSPPSSQRPASRTMPVPNRRCVVDASAVAAKREAVAAAAAAVEKAALPPKTELSARAVLRAKRAVSSYAVVFNASLLF
jgi:hypothetical protein